MREGNDGLYSHTGLARAKAALKPGGVLAVWSAAPDAAFARRMREAGFAVEEVAVRARSNGKGPRHVIWLARKVRPVNRRASVAIRQLRSASTTSGWWRRFRRDEEAAALRKGSAAVQLVVHPVVVSTSMEVPDPGP